MRESTDDHMQARAGRAAPRWGRRSRLLGGAVALLSALGSVGLAGAATTTAAAPAQSSVVTITPVRVLDTRTGTGATQAPIGQGASINVTVAGVSGIPATATGVLLNVTEVNGTAASYLTVWPTGASQPNASSLNWNDSGAHPNGVSTAVGTSGQVSFYNNGGSVDVLADVVGYYTAEGAGGPAGGVLTGTYPNPGLGAGVVQPSNLFTGLSKAGYPLVADGRGSATTTQPTALSLRGVTASTTSSGTYTNLGDPGGLEFIMYCNSGAPGTQLQVYTNSDYSTFDGSEIDNASVNSATPTITTRFVGGGLATNNKTNILSVSTSSGNSYDVATFDVVLQSSAASIPTTTVHGYITYDTRSGQPLCSIFGSVVTGVVPS